MPSRGVSKNFGERELGCPDTRDLRTGGRKIAQLVIPLRKSGQLGPTCTLRSAWLVTVDILRSLRRLCTFTDS